MWASDPAISKKYSNYHRILKKKNENKGRTGFSGESRAFRFEITVDLL